MKERAGPPDPVDTLDLMGLPLQFFFIEAMGDPERCRVIGAENILIAERLTFLCQLFQGKVPVAPVGMDVQVPLYVGGFD